MLEVKIVINIDFVGIIFHSKYKTLVAFVLKK